MILKLGSYGREVKGLQFLLLQNGDFAPDHPVWQSKAAKRLGISGPDHKDAVNFIVDGDFGVWTEEAVKYFQARAMDETGKALANYVKLGEVDDRTLTALKKTNQIKSPKTVPIKGPGGLGICIIDIWDHYIDIGVKEIPNGSNRSPQIDKWTGYVNVPQSKEGPYWCGYSRAKIEWEAHKTCFDEGKYFQSDARVSTYASTINNMEWAKRNGLWVSLKQVLNGYKLPTGAAMIIDYGGHKGHTESVAMVKYKNGIAVAIENRGGNISNKVAAISRKLAPPIAGFIVSPLLLEKPDFAGISRSKITVSDGKENTR